MSCEGIELQLSSSELTFAELEDKFYSMLEKIPTLKHRGESGVIFQ